MNNIQIINYMIKHSNINRYKIEIIRLKGFAQIQGEIYIDGRIYLFNEDIRNIDRVVDILNRN
jgi:hypothetical protein